MKKVLAIILSLVLVMAITLPAAAVTAVKKSTPAPMVKAAKITYMNWGNTAEQQVLLQVIKNFQKVQKNVTVRQVPVPKDQYITKINTLAASNSLPDCAIMDEAMVLKWADNNLFADVSDAFTGDNKKLPALGFRDKNGKVVAYSSADEVLVMYYSKPMFDKAGVSYPPATADKAWTWDQFLEASKKLTKDKNGKTPNDAGFDKDNIVTYGSTIDTTTWMWPVFGLSNGGGLVSEDGKKLLFGTPETIEAAQAIADLSLKHFVSPKPAAAKTLPSIDNQLLSGKVAMAMGGQWNVGTAFGPRLKDGLKYGVGVLPKFKRAVTYCTGGPNVVFKSSKNLAAAKSFVVFVSKEENNLPTITSGIWMPSSESWYKDAAKIKTWTDNPAHAALMPEYKTAVIEYAMNNQSSVPWYFCTPYYRMQDVITPGMDPVWAGTKTAKEAIDAMMPKLQEIFNSNKS